MTRGRWIALVVLILAGVYAWGAGAYSGRNYLALRRQQAAATLELHLLQHEVDSLKSFRDSLETDPVVQERVAREQWGMLRPGEMSFLIVPDSDLSPPKVAKKP